MQIIIGLLFHYVLIAIVAHAQNYSSCEPLEQYVDEHPDCYVYHSYYYHNDEPCSGIRCVGSGPNDTNITYLFTSFTVQRCQDPVTLYTYTNVYQNDLHHYYLYIFNQSERVDNVGYYYHHYLNTSYTAILDRNASHLGFEVLNMMYACEYNSSPNPPRRSP